MTVLRWLGPQQVRIEGRVVPAALRWRKHLALTVPNRNRWLVAVRVGTVQGFKKHVEDSWALGMTN